MSHLYVKQQTRYKNHEFFNSSEFVETNNFSSLFISDLGPDVVRSPPLGTTMTYIPDNGQCSTMNKPLGQACEIQITSPNTFINWPCGLGQISKGKTKHVMKVAILLASST